MPIMLKAFGYKQEEIWKYFEQTQLEETIMATQGILDMIEDAKDLEQARLWISEHLDHMNQELENES